MKMALRMGSLKVHPSVTVASIMAATQRYRSSTDNPGICLGCGLECEGVEPDARKYPCESCGEPYVYGAEELAMLVAS
jgi:hypothetical protein